MDEFDCYEPYEDDLMSWEEEQVFYDMRMIEEEDRDNMEQELDNSGPEV